MEPLRIVGIITARYASTRMPGKPLVPILGKPMVQRVYERSLSAKGIDRVYVATEDERIVRAVEDFGGCGILTSPDHPSGTDRLAEVAENLDVDIVVNIQGDQPFIDPIMIEEALSPLLEDPSVSMATLMHKIERPEDLEDSGVVKTVVDLKGNALYFSRSLIPASQNGVPRDVYEHVGLYVYRREFLIRIASLPPTPLEQVESLEQLRVIEHGYPIRVVETSCKDNEFSGFSIDTPADVKRGEAMLRERGLE